jgi:methylated-DNA-[protein]-cysteine S-methyltransferase
MSGYGESSSRIDGMLKVEVSEMSTHCQWIQESPFGPLLVETGDNGVRSVELKPGSTNGSTMCKDCAEVQLAFDKYFSGDGDALANVAVDVSAAKTDFHRKVLKVLHDTVPAGATTSYGELATAAGRPGAARAVGSAMANNPVPIIVPCHRVLASDGKLGGYGGGLEMKRKLLELEGAHDSTTSRLRP